MKPLSRFLSILLGLGGIVGSAASGSAADLATAQKSNFFSFFNLEASCPPVPSANRQAWHCFRPSGPKFRALVELDVLTDAKGGIVASQLGMDRAFIDSGGTAPFARDIGISYFRWAAPNAPGDIAILAYNIGDMSQAGGTVIMHQDVVKSVPDDTTGGYAVFLGKADKVSLTRPGFTLTLTNLPGAFPTQQIFAAGPGAPPDRRWLRIAVQLGG
jgi:hypothetical protein